MAGARGFFAGDFLAEAFGAAAFAGARFFTRRRAGFFGGFFLRDAMALDAKESRTLRQDTQLCACAGGC
jgi:hypothetical protein